MAISTPMLVTFCVYIFGMILIGFIAWRSTKNFDDYILGGRSLGPFVTALSAGGPDTVFYKHLKHATRLFL